MHNVFQQFIDLLSAAEQPDDFSNAMAVTAAALDLASFAYLALPQSEHEKPRPISTYLEKWTSHYLRNHYQRIDPVIAKSLERPEPFRWGAGLLSGSHSPAQQQLLHEASEFGIRFGFAVPIHHGHRPVAALTFAQTKETPRSKVA